MSEERDSNTFRVMFLFLIAAMLFLVSLEKAAYADEQVDQGNLPPWAGGWTNINPTPEGLASMWQTFTPGRPNITAVAIDILTVNPGQGDDTLTVEIAKDGEILASAKQSVEDGFDGLLRFEFDEAVAVVPGELYELKVHDTGKTCFGWKYASNTYESGSRYVLANERPGTDWFFRTYSMEPRVIYVDAAAAGANDGTSWENAYAYLQDALADANDAEKPVEIRVAQGVYKPDQGANQTAGDREATFHLINGVTLKGGYAGLGTPDPNARDIELYETILSGDLYVDDANVADTCDLPEEPTRAENSCHVVTGSNTDETAVLDGFTIAGGSDGNVIGTTGDLWWYGYGGGLYNFNGSPTLISCTFLNNWASGLGGGMYNECGNPKLTNCIFTDNIAGEYGGGMANIYSNTILTDCIFSGNHSGYEAGGMDNKYSSSTLINCIFSANSALIGGGMRNETYNEICILILTNCTFIGNSGMFAAGMSNYYVSPSLTNCNFIGNSAIDGGGGMDNLSSSPTMTNCIFSANYAKWGGAIDNSYSSPTLTNCIISANSATYGGGTNNLESNLTLNNCTFAQNSAQYGNTLSCDSSPRQGTFPSNFELKNCILWNGGNEIWNNDDSGIEISYSNVQGSWPGDGNIVADPYFADLGYWANVDDPNIVVEPNELNAVWVDGDYHLKSQAGRRDPVSQNWIMDDITSPCIDAGDPNSPVGDEPEPNGGRINMGVYGGTEEASKSYTSQLFQTTRGLIDAYRFKARE